MNQTDCDCGERTCYDCRRQEIDKIAFKIVEREKRICYGMSGFDIEAHAWKMATLFRDQAVTALAFELD
jgi:hypothetical protein